MVEHLTKDSRLLSHQSLLHSQRNRLELAGPAFVIFLILPHLRSCIQLEIAFSLSSVDQFISPPCFATLPTGPRFRNKRVCFSLPPAPNIPPPALVLMPRMIPPHFPVETSTIKILVSFFPPYPAYFSILPASPPQPFCFRNSPCQPQSSAQILIPVCEISSKGPQSPTQSRQSPLLLVLQPLHVNPPSQS